jgi:predicted metal-dependent hydrolase
MDNKKRFVEVKDKKVAYTVVKTRRKTIGIIIDRNGEVKVRAPLYVSEKQIYEVVRKKANWIVKKISEVIERNSNLVYRQYVNGEKILYLGKEYTLEITEWDSGVKRNPGKVGVLVKEYTLVVHISQGLSAESRAQAVKEALIKWYRLRFAETVKERIEEYSLQLKVSPAQKVLFCGSPTHNTSHSLSALRILYL